MDRTNAKIGSTFCGLALSSILLCISLFAASPARFPARAIRPSSPKSALPDLTDPLLLAPIVSGASGVTGVATGDLNGDGKLDLVLTAYPYGAVAILLGNGDGTFQGAGTYFSGGAANSVVVADLNEDGHPDLVVANQGAAGGDGSVGVLLGNGDGTFQPTVNYDSGAYGARAVAVGDLNRDGHLDLVIANCSPDSSNACNGVGRVGVLLGNGDGTFQLPVAYTAGGTGANSVAIADFNGDGKLDVVVANTCADPRNCVTGTVGVLYGNGNGTLQLPIVYATGAEGLAVGDLNADGKPDIVTPSSILLNMGDGTFAPPVSYDPGGGSLSCAITDVNGDGRPDLVVPLVQGNDGNGKVAVLLGNGNGTVQPPLTFDSGAFGAEAEAIGDLNGDGRPDVAVANGSGSLGVLLNNTGPHTPTTTALVSSANPIGIRKTVTYTATVTTQAGDATGTVSFKDGDKTIATVNVTANQAAFSTFYKTIGTHAITAVYSGDIHNSVSASSVLTEYVQGATKTVVTTSGSPSHAGQPVTFTATVTSKFGPIPDGELVKFFDSTKLLGSVHLSGGMAAFTTSSLSVGTHTIKATYVGDLLLKKSTGKVFQTVEP
ncbi:MAG: FG-GAP-like repeat-containing protein [Terriglobales bacterium]